MKKTTKHNTRQNRQQDKTLSQAASMLLTLQLANLDNQQTRQTAATAQLPSADVACCIARAV